MIEIFGITPTLWTMCSIFPKPVKSQSVTL